jgi:methionyl-tRNA formyltransferase
VGIRAVFLGTPAFAVPTLDAMVAAGHQVERVYTQPDRPKGRGQQLAMSPVKEAALRHGIEVFQPQRIRTCVDELRAVAPDVMVVVGYGQIIPQAIIDIAPRGILNVHASLLPKYRGAAPIQWAIANGEADTGVSIMNINAGLDTGPVLLSAATPILPDETSPQLSVRLAEMGAMLLTLALDQNPKPVPQDDALATLAPILTKEDGHIDWTQPAQVIYNRLRGFDPWPGAWTEFRGTTLHVRKARPEASGVVAPGTLHIENKRLFVGCGQASRLELIEVQLEGRNRVRALDFANGARLGDNESFTNLSGGPRS